MANTLPRQTARPPLPALPCNVQRQGSFGHATAGLGWGGLDRLGSPGRLWSDLQYECLPIAEVYSSCNDTAYNSDAAHLLISAALIAHSLFFIYPLSIYRMLSLWFPPFCSQNKPLG